MATGALVRNPESSGSYSYASQPRAIGGRQKYREPDTSRPANIMYDKRIVRGNTYALHTLPASSQPNPMELQKQQESRRRTGAYRRARAQMRIRSPPPLEGRKHIDVQTELYLEEITDRVEEADVQVQTDAFLDRPPTPLFIPAKTGVDVATQIEEGDLFDFDREVCPILEVLVGKTIEQALLEVMEEEELAALREQQRIFEGNRNAELVETQRLEEQERRYREEKERRMQQQREALMKEKETAEKVAARAFAQSYLSDLVPAVFSSLSQNGFFYDPIERDIETTFIPWLMEEAEILLDKKLSARLLLDVIIRQVVKKKLGIVTPPPAEQPTDKPEKPDEDPIEKQEKPDEDPIGKQEKPEDPTEKQEKPDEDPTNKQEKPDEDPTEKPEKPEDPIEKQEKPDEDPTEKPEKPEDPTDQQEKPDEDPAEKQEKPDKDPTEKQEKPDEDPTEKPEKPEDPTDQQEKPDEDPAEKQEKPTEKLVEQDNIEKLVGDEQPSEPSPQENQQTEEN